MRAAAYDTDATGARGRYKGTWYKGQMRGQGFFTSADGWSCTGNFEPFAGVGSAGRAAVATIRSSSGQQGTVTSADGDQSEGAPPRSGQHTHRYRDGHTYNGNFVDGLPHGQGEMVYANGNRCL